MHFEFYLQGDITGMY